MSETSAWLGIDVGTQSVRAIAIADDGSVLASSSAALQSERVGVQHEQDAESWWTAAQAAIGRVTDALPAGHRIRALAVSATSGTIVVVDDALMPVGAGIMYDDARGATELDEVLAVGTELWARLGHRPSASWALPKLVGIVRGGAVPTGGRVLHQADVVTSRLAGRLLATDTSHALKSGVDLDSAAWPIDVFEALGIDGVLPEVVLPGTVIGQVDARCAAELGLPTDCAIVAGMTDGCAAQLAAGALTPGSWNSVLGTTLVIKGFALERRPDPTGAVYAHRAPFGAGWFPGGASSSGAGALTQWLPGRDLVGLASSLGERYVPAVAYPLPGTGERFPFVAPEATAVMPDLDDDAQMFAAIAAGIAAIERLGYETLGSAGYDIAGDLFATGGGSRSRWWNQLRADMLARPIRVPENGEGAIGMAMLAAAAFETGCSAPLESVAVRLLRPAPTVHPRGARSNRLDDYYGEVITLLESRGWLRQRAA